MHNHDHTRCVLQYKQCKERTMLHKERKYNAIMFHNAKKKRQSKCVRPTHAKCYNHGLWMPSMPELVLNLSVVIYPYSYPSLVRLAHGIPSSLRFLPECVCTQLCLPIQTLKEKSLRLQLRCGRMFSTQPLMLVARKGRSAAEETARSMFARLHRARASCS